MTKKLKNTIEAFDREARKHGMRYAEYQAKMYAEKVKIGQVPSNYRKVGNNGRQGKV